MEIDWGAVTAILTGVVLVGGLIAVYVKMQVSLKAIEVRQDNQDARIDALKEMIEKQINVDSGIKDMLQELKVAIARLETKVGE